MSDFQRPNEPQRPSYESYTQPLPPSQDWGAAAGSPQAAMPPTSALPPANAMPPVMSPYANQSYYVPMMTAAPSQRPGGVTAIAIWHWVLAGLYGLVGLLLIGLGGTVMSMLAREGNVPAGAGTLGFGIFLVFFVILAVIAGVLFLAGRGLWKMTNTGRILTIVVDGMYAGLMVLGLLGGGQINGTSVVGLLIAVATIVYLNLPQVRMLFR